MISRKPRTKIASTFTALTFLIVVGAIGCKCDSEGIPDWVQGDMVVDPVDIPASGNLEAEVSVWVYEKGNRDKPLQGITITVESSRNQGGSEIDTIEQPTSPTDADGRAVAFLGSSTAGEVQLIAKQSGSGDDIGAPICEVWSGSTCATPLQRMVTFYVACPSGTENCDGECVDTSTDESHCGACNNICDFANAAEDCVDGVCVMGACEDDATHDWEDCNSDDSDGCEADVNADPNNCGTCGNACDPGFGCVDGACYACDDEDNDSYCSEATGGDDCDDSNPDVYPGAPELCDAIDNNCDTQVDEDPEASTDCDDGNVCTDDQCIRGQGCINIILDGSTYTCDDGNDCTINDYCRGGVCLGDSTDGDGDGEYPEACGGCDCDDTDPQIHCNMWEGGQKEDPICSDGKDNDCDGATDEEQTTCNICPDDAYCDNGDACDGVERCVNQYCVAGTPVVCEDNDPCTRNQCDSTDGSCSFPPMSDGSSCDDGDACTLGDICIAGICRSGSQQLNCNDADPCTDDSCVPATGCVYTNNTASCDDGNPCTTDDTCAGGFCQAGSGTLTCDDSEPCTDDSCNPASGCVFAPNTNACNDNNPCTIGDVCGGGTCQPGAASFCDDGRVCTDDACDPSDGSCTYTNNTDPCDDNNACTMNDTCDNGQCGGVPADVDGDGYAPAGCGGVDCDDTDPNVPIVYEGPYDDPMCADGIDNDCDGLTDTSDNGCVQCTVDGDCDDGNVCTGAETCVATRCVAGTALDCDDSNICTIDGCDRATGCYNLDNNNQPCNDNDACTRTDMCQGGACVGSDPVVCTPLSQCHDAGTCDAGTGVCDNPMKTDGTACNDNNLCTQTDTCVAGVCTGADPVVCTPLDDCHNAGTCTPSTGVCNNPAKVDGSPCDDGNACTQTDTCQSGTCVGSNPVVCVPLDQCHNAGVCDAGTGVCTDPPKADGAVCDDADACTQTDTCQAGVCTGSNPVVCTASDQCHDAGTCDPGTGNCSNPAKPDNTPCDDGNACTQTDTCQVGICDGANPVVCTPLDQCHDAGTCQPATGNCTNPNKTDGTACDDGDNCSSADTCQGGNCTAGATDKDTDSDTYFDGNCPFGDDCDDGVAAINPGVMEGPQGDPTCFDSIDNDCDNDVDGVDPGCTWCANDAQCDDSNDCTTDTCIVATGQCQNTAVSDGTGCNDGNLCTQTDSCTGGVCVGSNPVICTALDQCHTVGVCNPATGNCSNPSRPDGAPCDDGDACTQTDECQSGSCVGSDPVVCTASDQCHNAGVCLPASGLCTDPPKADGAPCDDGNACTQTDSCQSGVCTGADPVVCTPLDQCHDVGTCNPSTGNCSNPNKTDGTPCDDGDACTQTDTCQSGNCQGSDPVVCTPLDQCHNAGTCNSSTGNCSNPQKADGSPCDDGNNCSSADTCQGGTCTAGATDKDTDGDTYLDGNCPGGNDCNDTRIDINPGASEGPPPTAPACSDTWDNDCDGDTDIDDIDCKDCLAHSDCDDANACTTDLCIGSLCQNNPVADGSSCDDGDACTQTDECQSGVCVGSNPVVCTPLDQCHNAGTCDSGTGLCSDPPKSNGTSCDDGDACTQTDTCQSGVCTGADPVVCTPLDQCHDAGTCNPSTGNCSNPNKANGSPCDDGNLCTQTDECQGGTCTGSNPVVCTPLDQCHSAGICNPSTGNCSNPSKPNGSPCDDGNECTQTDECQAGSCQGSDPVICTPLDQCHNAGTCNPSTGLCSNPTKSDGTPCDDGDECTQTDTCQTGNCVGADPVVCTPLDQCHDAGTCNPSTGNCSNPNKTNGTPCNDGNPCSTLDTCQDGTCTAGATNKDTDSDTYLDGACPGGDDCDDGEAAVNPGATEGPFGHATCSDTWDNDCDTLVDMNDVDCMQCTIDSQCDDSNECTTDTCVSGACQNTPVSDGTSCDDSDACTQTDECQSGACVGTNPVVCTPSDQCHNAGVCNPGTGVCSDPQKPNGSPCDDSDACTQTDECQSGNCVGSDPVVCTPLDQCHNAGTCNPVTGLCSNPPKTDGSPCNDGDACTQTDTCQSAVCTGADPVVCTALDDCHNVGTCNPGTGICSNPQKPNGSACDDSDACTQTDECQSGNCVGSDPVVCTPLDQCHNAGTCDPGTGVCSDPPKVDGSPCDDGDLCTQTDTCQSGTCTGADPIVCTASDPCHDVGVCNPGTGVCSDPPKADGSPCDDGDLCTYDDECTGGVCGGTSYSCDDFSPCTTDSCNGDSTCTNTPRADYWNDPLHEWTETSCDSNDNDCDGCIDENCPGYSEPIVAAEVIPYSIGPGLRRISGNGQFAPIGQDLANELIVQLNNGSGVPIKGEMITFLVEPLTDGQAPEDPESEGVCYGDNMVDYDCSDSAQGRICPLPVMKLCNNALGTLIDASGTPGSTFDVPTDDNGQARIRFRLSASDTGFHVVSATYAGPPVDTVYFFSASGTELSDTITVASAGDPFPAVNPALGPLNLTKWNNDGNRPTDMGYFTSYQLAITGLSTDNATCTNGEFPQGDITAGGDLYICGERFSASGNTVWVGGVQATIVSQASDLIRVTIPEGLPGATSVIVDDGTTTICKDDHGVDDSSANSYGDLPSRAAATSNFIRLAPKPISIFTQTGSLAGSSANVKLLGLDTCGNPLDLTGHTIDLDVYNPDKSSASTAMTVGSPHASTGIASVDANNSGTVRAGVVIGTVNGISSDSMLNGNTVVSAVPRAAPAQFIEDPTIGYGGNADGINSMMIRGSDERNSDQMEHQNPAVRMRDGYESVELDTHRIPWGGTPFETEAAIVCGTMTGEGDLANLGLDGFTAIAGTSMGVISGGAQGLVIVLAATIGIDPDTGMADEEVMSVPATVLTGWLRSPGPGGDQELESFVNSMLFFEDGPGGYPRGMSIRLYVIRSMP